MEHINKFLHNSKYKGLKKPLQAAEVCDAARKVAKDRFSVVSYNAGVLCLGVSSPAEAANIQAESSSIIDNINKELKDEKVKRIRYKIE